MPADRPNVPLTPAQLAEVDRLAAEHRWSRARTLAVLVERGLRLTDAREIIAEVEVSEAGDDGPIYYFCPWCQSSHESGGRKKVHADGCKLATFLREVPSV